MDINSFIHDFALQFDETPETEFTADTPFRNIEEWNSMIALSIIAMADENYAVKLTGDDIRNAETISDLYNKVESLLS